MSRGVHAFWFPPLFLDARLLWALSLFKDWVYFGCLSLSFSFFSSVSIIHFATISMVRVVMDIFINQSASKLFIDFLLCFLLKSGTRGFFVLARVCSSCAGVNIVDGLMVWQCGKSRALRARHAAQETWQNAAWQYSVLLPEEAIFCCFAVI